MIHTIIFDIGGTLLRAPDLFGELANLYPGVDAIAPLRDGVLGRYHAVAEGRAPFATMEAIISDTLREVSGMLGLPDMSCHAFDVYYQTFVTKSELFQGTIPVLDWLKSHGVNMVVASDGDHPLLQAEFKLHGIGGYFRDVFISSEVGAYKPNQAFVKALRQAVPNPEAALSVGDSDCDVETGKALGARTILIGGADTPACNPDYRIRDLSEVVEIIKQLSNS